MGRKQLEIDEQIHEVEDTATVGELKANVGAGSNDMATYVEDDGSWVTLSDRDSVEAIPNRAKVAFQPGDTRFGGNGG